MSSALRKLKPVLYLVRTTGIEPVWVTPDGFSYHFGFRRRLGRSWSGLSLRRAPMIPECRRCPSSLYTFPLRGLARDCHFTGFPEFEQFCILDFPRSTQSIA